MSKTLTLLSSIDDVQEFLNIRNFDEIIRSKFIKYTGDALLGSTNDSLIRICGIDEGDRLVGILNSIKTATSAQDLESNSMFDWLAQKSGSNPLTNSEQIVFHLKFPNYAIPLKERKLGVKEARTLVQCVRNIIKSNTAAIMRSEGYIFDGLLGQTGGGKALLYHVINLKNSKILCGKVYCVENETAETIIIERSSSDILHKETKHPNIVEYLDIKEFSHETAPSNRMIVLIMPLYPMSLATALDALYDVPVPLDMFLNLAKCLLSACSRFEEVGKCHCDVKPENIMFSNESFVLIDLGAVTDIGQNMREYTRGYGLDACQSYLASTKYDLNCIAVTLGRCCIKNFVVKIGLSIAQYVDILSNDPCIDVGCKEVIMKCISTDSCIEVLNML